MPIIAPNTNAQITRVMTRPGLFMLDDLLLGEPDKFPISEVDWGTNNVDYSTYNNIFADGRIFGPGYSRGSSITLTGGFLPHNGQTLTQIGAKLEKIWGSYNNRNRAGRVVQLFYRRDRGVRFFVGRPKRIQINYGGARAQFGRFVLEFERTNQFSYGNEHAIDIRESNKEFEIITPNSDLLAPSPAAVTLYGETPSAAGSININQKSGQGQILGAKVLNLALGLKSGESITASNYPGDNFIVTNTGESARYRLAPVVGRYYISNLSDFVLFDREVTHRTYITANFTSNNAIKAKFTYIEASYGI